MLDHLTPKR